MENEPKKYNSRWLEGNVTQLPKELFSPAKGTRMAAFSIAVTQKGVTNYVDITIFGDNAIDTALLIKDKGTPVAIYGEFSKREVGNGNIYYKHAGHHIRIPSNVLYNALRGAAPAAPQNTYAATDQHPALGEEDDDIPF